MLYFLHHALAWWRDYTHEIKALAVKAQFSSLFLKNFFLFKMLMAKANLCFVFLYTGLTPRCKTQ